MLQVTCDAGGHHGGVLPPTLGCIPPVFPVPLQQSGGFTVLFSFFPTPPLMQAGSSHCAFRVFHGHLVLCDLMAFPAPGISKEHAKFRTVFHLDLGT